MRTRSSVTESLHPWVTLWNFHSQVVDADGSCRQAVSRVSAFFRQHDQPPPAAETGAYCRARQHLPESLLARLVRRTGAALDAQALPDERWFGRCLRVVDGSGVSMPDTPANQKAYPQPPGQAPGCGFPVLRIVACFSLLTGAVLEYACGSLHDSEMRLFRTLLSTLAPGDLLLGDRYYGVFAVLSLSSKNNTWTASSAWPRHGTWISGAAGVSGKTTTS
jgi:hypothetical protein